MQVKDLTKIFKLMEKFSIQELSLGDMRIVRDANIPPSIPPFLAPGRPQVHNYNALPEPPSPESFEDALYELRSEWK